MTLAHPLDGAPTTPCRSCGQPMVFCWTGRAAQPVDPLPHPDGNLRVWRDGAGSLRSKVSPPDLLGEPRYLPHHASCPQGAEWKHQSRPKAKRTSP